MKGPALNLPAHLPALNLPAELLNHMFWFPRECLWMEGDLQWDLFCLLCELIWHNAILILASEWIKTRKLLCNVIFLETLEWNEYR